MRIKTSLICTGVLAALTTSPVLAHGHHHRCQSGSRTNGHGKHHACPVVHPIIEAVGTEGHGHKSLAPVAAPAPVYMSSFSTTAPLVKPNKVQTDGHGK